MAEADDRTGRTASGASGPPVLEWGAMPWCPECDRFLSPATVTAEGSCPRCGLLVEPGRARAPEPDAGPSSAAGSPTAPSSTSDAAPAVGSAGNVGAAGEADKADEGHEGDGEGLPPVPWHLKLMVGALAVYLGWRAMQGIEWVARQL